MSYPEAFEFPVELHISSYRRYSEAKGVLNIFAKFTGRHLSQSLFFNKATGLKPTTLLEERLWYRCFPMNIEKLLRTPILKNICERLLLVTCWKSTKKLNRGDLLLLPCLVYMNISYASSFSFFYLRFLCTCLENKSYLVNFGQF